MELRERLQDYTRAEFVSFIEHIKKVEGSKDDHDKLIRHFDLVVKHPKGADLLFYPEADPYSSGLDGAGSIIFNIKKWHNDNGQLAFKDDSFPLPRQKPGKGTPQPSAKDKAWKASSENLVKVQKVAAQINQAKLTAEDAFNKLEALLDSAVAKLRVPTPDAVSKERVALLTEELSGLEAAQHAVIRGVHGYNFLNLTVKFAKDDAQRSISRPQLDRQLQTSILQQMTQTNDLYLAQIPVFGQRQQDLHRRTEATFKDVEEHLIRVATTIGSGPMMEASTFSITAGDPDATPRVLTTNFDVSDSFETVLPDLKHAIQSAIAGLAWASTSADGEQTVKYASVISFQFDKPGYGEPYAISVPLSELAPTEGQDWQYLADTGAEVDLAFRMSSGVTKVKFGKLSYGLKEINELAHAYVVSTNSTVIPSKVKVRAAVWDAESSMYRFISPGFPANTVLWSLQSPSDTGHLSTSDLKRSTRSGFIAPVSVPVVEMLPSIEDLHFDDCIVVFPTDSGIEPVYVMFKGRKEYPGAASGAGQVITGEWLRSDADIKAAPIPSQIADQLRGKVFKRFSTFREVFWKAVANASELSMQFSAEDLAAMKEGHAPHAPTRSQQAEADRFEIHHVIAPDSGGNVYDMDNMQVMMRPHAGADNT